MRNSESASSPPAHSRKRRRVKSVSTVASDSRIVRSCIVRYRTNVNQRGPMMALRLIAHLHKATHQVGLYIHRELSELGISQAEAHVLSHLSMRGPCSIADVHHSFGHRRSTLTSILNRLEDQGLIAREVHPDDRRSLSAPPHPRRQAGGLQRQKNPGATRSRGSLLPERAAGRLLRRRDRGDPDGSRGRREGVEAPPVDASREPGAQPPKS